MRDVIEKNEKNEIVVDEMAKLVDKMLDDFASAPSLRALLADYNVEPHRFYDTLHSHPRLHARYKQLQELRSELLADDIITIADTETDQFRARNRIEARKWYASKLFKQKYGDTLDINLTKTVDISVALREAHERRKTLSVKSSVEIKDKVRPGRTALLELDELDELGDSEE